MSETVGDAVRVGIAHHLGWAVAITADERGGVVDRRRIQLVDAGLPAAPVHHEGGAHALHRNGPALSDDELGELVAQVRASAERMASIELQALEVDLGVPVRSISVRTWPDAVPTDVATMRRAPHESRIDSIMYCQVLAEVARARGWRVHRYDAKLAERNATALLGERAHEVLHGPRARLGPPWTKDHRLALAATVLAAVDGR